MIKSKGNINQLRSYSNIFSSTSFFNLLKKDDYSFLDSKITRYDKHLIGTEVVTYYDYISYTYNELKKHYRNEYIYKNTFLSEILISKYGVKDTIAINEFRIGNSIADIVLFNGKSKAFEIKSELDSDKRLVGQIENYKKVFCECFIITHESLADKYLKTDDTVGIIALTNKANKLNMHEVRPAITNNDLDYETVIRVLRTAEYKNIIKAYYGYLPEMNSFNMFNICKELMQNIPASILRQLFIKQLKKRKSNTHSLSVVNKELRQMALALNVDLNKYGILLSKLKVPIKT